MTSDVEPHSHKLQLPLTRGDYRIRTRCEHLDSRWQGSCSGRRCTCLGTGRRGWSDARFRQKGVAQRAAVRGVLDHGGMPQNFIGCDRDHPFDASLDMREWLPESHLVWLVFGRSLSSASPDRWS